MTNEDAIKQLLDAEHCLAGHGDLWDVDMEAFEMAIKALKQESVLDKIREEIQKLRNCSCSNSDGIIDDVEDILDKYKAESEEENELQNKNKWSTNIW